MHLVSVAKLNSMASESSMVEGVYGTCSQTRVRILAFQKKHRTWIFELGALHPYAVVPLLG